MKITQHKFAVIFSLMIIIIACTNCASQSKLPDTWQPGMVLTITYGGGMRYYSSEIAIQETGSYRLINEEGKTTRDTLTFTKKQLDDLIRFLKNKKFDQIDSNMRPGIVYDMGTTSTILQWGNNTEGVTISATQNISKSDQDNYNEIRAYIDKLLAKK